MLDVTTIGQITEIPIHITFNTDACLAYNHNNPMMILGISSHTSVLKA